MIHATVAEAEPTANPLFPDLHFLVMLGKTFFEIENPPLNRLASRRKERQPHHDEQNPLEYRQKKADDAQEEKRPARNQDPDFLKFRQKRVRLSQKGQRESSPKNRLSQSILLSNSEARKRTV